MKRFICFLVGFGMILGLHSGCSNVDSESSSSVVELSTSVVENVFQTALTVAANILASDGTQQLAIAAAESYAASAVEDPTQLQAINSIIESAIPELADGIASTINSGVSSKAVLKKDKTQIIRSTYVKSESFQNLVKDCVKQYQKK